MVNVEVISQFQDKASHDEMLDSGNEFVELQEEGSEKILCGKPIPTQRWSPESSIGIGVICPIIEYMNGGTPEASYYQVGFATPKAQPKEGESYTTILRPQRIEDIHERYVILGESCHFGTLEEAEIAAADLVRLYAETTSEDEWDREKKYTGVSKGWEIQ